MLSLERLMDEAKLRGLPLGKKRAVMREYAQIVMLQAVYRHKFGQQMYFMGGTALRFAFDLPRFSEDLDFNGEGLSKADFEEMLNKVKSALEKEGFNSEFNIKERGTLFVGNVRLSNILQLYNASVAKSEKLLIKVEVNQPQRKMLQEPHIITGFGYSFSALLMERSHLISEKLATFLNRKRGRDIYDILFMLRRKIPFDKYVLKTVGIKDSPKDFILEWLKKLSEKELKFLAEQVRPFLFKEEDVELVLKAPLYAERFLEAYE